MSIRTASKCPGSLADEGQALFRAGAFRVGADLVEQLPEGKALLLQLHAAGLDAADVEDVVDDGEQVARACRNEETKDVRFARYGGDEFFGITRRLSDEEVCGVARRIAGNIRNADLPNVNNPSGGRITLSIGVVNMEITDKTNTILDVANNADKALYYAKSSGKNAIYQQLCGADADGNNASYIRIDF